MNANRTCPKCAAPLPADAPQGHCPQCLLSLALAAPPGPDTAAALEQATLDSGTAAASESRASGTGTGTVRLTSPTEQPGDTIGRYKLLQKVGEGGCGTVYMAEQSEPVRRKVALKVIKLGMDTKSVIARFDAERQALAMMDHPNIAKVLDAGATAAGRPYFVMELVRGIPITKYCDENHLPTKDRLDLFIAVCSAIQHAHQKGIIHRDIKPSNILVTLHDGVPVPKVIDFGIAKATEARLTDLTLFTELHAFVGTPAYMSPEQAEMSGLDMDTRADIYSLGVLLYELLSGKLPFDPETLLKAGLDEMRRTIREVEPPKPSTRLSTVTGGDLTAIAKHRGTEAAKLSTLLRGDLDWIVMKALEKDRTRRYESASAFAQDIKRHLGNEAVLACPPSAAYLLQKLVRRHRLAFAAGAAIAASLVIGLSVSTWLFFKEKAARERAMKAEQEQIQLRKDAEAARAKEQELRVEAQTNEKITIALASKSKQVAKFMIQMLEGIPSAVRGRDTTVLREVLDATVRRVDEELADELEVQMDLRWALANVYQDLRLYDQAEALQRAALANAKSLWGPENPTVAKALHHLGSILFLQDKLKEAEESLREALAVEGKHLGSDHPALNGVRTLLARVLRQKGDLRDAESMLLTSFDSLTQLSAKVPASWGIEYRRKETRLAVQNLVEFYEATAQPNSVSIWKQKLAEFNQAYPELKPAPPITDKASPGKTAGEKIAPTGPVQDVIASACIANLQQIQAAIQKWADVNQIPAGTLMKSPQAILPYLKNEKWPVCPGGGIYSMPVKVGGKPTCSHMRGHAL